MIEEITAPYDIHVLDLNLDGNLEVSCSRGTLNVIRRQSLMQQSGFIGFMI